MNKGTEVQSSKFTIIVYRLLVLAIAIISIGCQSAPTPTTRTCHEDFVLNGMIIKASLKTAEERYKYWKEDLENCSDISLLSGKDLYEIASIVMSVTDVSVAFGNFINISDSVNFTRYYDVKSARTGYAPAVGRIENRLESKLSLIHI